MLVPIALRRAIYKRKLHYPMDNNTDFLINHRIFQVPLCNPRVVRSYRDEMNIRKAIPCIEFTDLAKHLYIKRTPLRVFDMMELKIIFQD
jgi:hypothetical protein